ncbi:hypothetical protein R3I94_015794 [Phoxinus phoxinus]
MWREKRD